METQMDGQKKNLFVRSFVRLFVVMTKINSVLFSRLPSVRRHFSLRPLLPVAFLRSVSSIKSNVYPNKQTHTVAFFARTAATSIRLLDDLISSLDRLNESFDQSRDKFCLPCSLEMCRPIDRFESLRSLVDSVITHRIQSYFFDMHYTLQHRLLWLDIGWLIDILVLSSSIHPPTHIKKIRSWRDWRTITDDWAILMRSFEWNDWRLVKAKILFHPHLCNESHTFS